MASTWHKHGTPPKHNLGNLSSEANLLKDLESKKSEAKYEVQNLGEVLLSMFSDHLDASCGRKTMKKVHI